MGKKNTILKILYIASTLKAQKWKKMALTLFLPAKGGISPYMSVTWPSPVGIGLKTLQVWMFRLA